MIIEKRGRSPMQFDFDEPVVIRDIAVSRHDGSPCQIHAIRIDDMLMAADFSSELLCTHFYVQLAWGDPDDRVTIAMAMAQDPYDFQCGSLEPGPAKKLVINTDADDVWVTVAYLPCGGPCEVEP